MSRILIVDDNSVDRELIADAIIEYSGEFYDSKWKLRITKVENAIKGLDVLKQHQFELIITDILMARMDGWDFIKEIRKNKSNSELPIVVVSVIDGVGLEYESKRNGASLWFTKPINPKEFSEKIFTLLQER